MSLKVFLMFLLVSACAFPQSNRSRIITIDTLAIRYGISGIAALLSDIPQVGGEIGTEAKNRINEDIKKLFPCIENQARQHSVCPRTVARPWGKFTWRICRTEAADTLDDLNFSDGVTREF